MPVALIVEDHEDQALVFESAVTLAGFETTQINNGRKASEFLMTNVPDVVILDLHLPDMTGDEILKQIRADERLSATKVILATADGALANRVEDQADLVLLKPVSFDQMKSLSKKVLKMNKRHQ
jgi:CheY-like chemotaxis protein